MAGMVLTSCGLFESSPNYVAEGKYSDINAQNIAAISPENEDTLRFAVIGDTQRYYEEAFGVVQHINQNAEVDFVIHTGDYVDFGLQREYNWMHEQLMELEVPYVAVVGNHDLIGNGDRIYEEMFGAKNFSFQLGDFRFVFINTNAQEYDTDNVPDIPWLEEQLADTADYDQATVVFHVQPMNNDFNPDLIIPFRSALDKYGKVRFVVHGHHHGYNYYQPYEEDVFYLNSSSPSKDQYILIQMWKDGYDHQLIEFD